MNLSFVRFYLRVYSFIRREVQYIKDINPRDIHFRKENFHNSVYKDQVNVRL